MKYENIIILIFKGELKTRAHRHVMPYHFYISPTMSIRTDKFRSVI